MALHRLSSLIQVFRRSQTEIFIAAAIAESISAQPHSVDLGLNKGVNNILSNQCGISGLPDTWITPDKLYGAF